MKGLRATLGITIGAAVCAFLVVYCHQFYVFQQAKKFVRDFKTPQPQVSRYDNVQNLEITYGGTESKDGSDLESKCDSNQLCVVRFAFLNTWLEHLHFAPYSALSAIVYLNRGVVLEKALTYEFFDGSLARTFSIADGNHRLTWSKCLEKVHVLFLGPDATQKDHDEAYSFDLSCLRRFGACWNGNTRIPITFIEKVPPCGAPVDRDKE
jgi:hypothetical protein